MVPSENVRTLWNEDRVQHLGKSIGRGVVSGLGKQPEVHAAGIHFQLHTGSSPEYHNACFSFDFKPKRSNNIPVLSETVLHAQ
jgi:hypothetical protein